MSIPYKKILLSLDGSDLAKEAIPHAAALTQQSQAELTLLRIVPDVLDEIGPSETLPFSVQAIDERQRELVDAATDALKAEVEHLAHNKVEAQAVVDVGRSADKIVDYAAKNDIDLIVMSTHGRTGVERWVMGSVAGKVSTAASCPVLLVRASL